jgi:hypothetical protein
MASPARRPIVHLPPLLSVTAIAEAVLLLADLEALKNENLIIEYVDEHGTTRFTPALLAELAQ